MTEKYIGLGRRAVTCKGWRWMPGILALPTDGMVSVPIRIGTEREWPHDLGLRLPDLTDAATIGCLLALVRESWGSTEIFALYSVDRGTWIIKRGKLLVEAKTEAEALVMALEAT